MLPQNWNPKSVSKATWKGLSDISFTMSPPTILSSFSSTLGIDFRKSLREKDKKLSLG